MLDELDNRVIQIANLMLEGNRTVREVAKIIGYSKSTVHYDLTKRLEALDSNLYLKIRKLLDYNKKIRPEMILSFRGGLCYSAKVKSTLPVGTFAAEHITFTLSPTE